MTKKNIEAILPLTALQQGFLWHSVASDADRSVGLIQMQCRLDGALAHDLFEQAWQQTVNQHQQLRASVHWRNVKQPVSVIQRQLPAEVQFFDWRMRTDHDESLESFLVEDLQSGLPIEQAPASRLTLIQTSEKSHELVWTCHHLLLDGWSGGLVIDEIFRRYDALANRTEFAATQHPTLSGYLKWLQACELEPAQQHWTDLLAGFKDPIELSGDGVPISCERILGLAETSSLMSVVRESRTTLNAWLQCAWAIVLGRISDCDDVVFGVTVSGRQIDFDGADQLIGMLINVLPVRVQLRPDLAADALLQEVQAQSFGSLPYAFVDAPQIQAWSQCPGKLFDSLIVVENQPAASSSESIEIKNQRSGIVSAYGITIVAKPGDELSLSLKIGESVFTNEQGMLLLDGLRSVLMQLAAAPSQLVRELELDFLKTIELSAAQPILERSSVDAKPDDTPVSLLEEKIRRIWKATLGVERIAPSDTFFDLGGTSMLALVMFNRLEAQIGVRLPTTTLLQHSTPTKLAELIRQDKATHQWADVVAIQIDGDKPPLFIPDTATDLLIYRHLARELGPSQPIYGFRARELRSLSFAELATRFNAQLRALQPQGPYHLAGLSSGGPLAWLMAQQLEEQGCTVGRLLLFDCLGPAYPRLSSPIRRLTGSLGAAWLVLTRKITEPGHDRPDATAQPVPPSTVLLESADSDQRRTQGTRALELLRSVTRSRSLGEKIANSVVLVALKIPAQSNQLAWAAFMQGLWLEQPNKELAENHDPAEPLRLAGEMHAHLYGDLKPYGGRIEFFRARERPPAILDDEFSGWQALVAGEFVVHEVPGNHLSLIAPPNVAGLAQILTSVLARAKPDSDT